MPDEIKRSGGIAGDIPTATNRTPKPSAPPTPRSDGRTGYTPMAPQGMAPPPVMGSYRPDAGQPNTPPLEPRFADTQLDMQRRAQTTASALAQVPSPQSRPSAQLPSWAQNVPTGQALVNQDILNVPPFNYGDRAQNAINSMTDTVGTVIGAGTAVPADALANATVRLMGGDPNTREGGATSHQDKFFPLLQQQMDNTKRTWQNIQAAGREALGVEAAQPKSASNQSDREVSTGSAEPNNTQGIAANITEQQQEAVTQQANQGVRSFNNQSAEGIAAGVNSVASFDAAGSQRANAAFERAIAAGDYEAALQTVNRFDTSAMQRLGQLQGNIREERRQRVANEPTSEQKDAAERAGIDQQRTMMAAREAMSKGSFRGAQRLMDAANGMQTSAGQPQPVTDLREGVDTYQDAQNTQVADYAMEGFKRTAEQERAAQGILEGLKSPDLSQSERQELLYQYSILQGAGQKAGDRYVMVDQVIGQDIDGKPITARVAVDPASQQSYGVDPQGLPSFAEAAAEARRAISANPDAKEQIEARLRDMYGRGL